MIYKNDRPYSYGVILYQCRKLWYYLASIYVIMIKKREDSIMLRDLCEKSCGLMQQSVEEKKVSGCLPLV